MFAFDTRSLATAISFGVLRRSFVPQAGASGTTSRRPYPFRTPRPEHDLQVRAMVSSGVV